MMTLKIYTSVLDSEIVDAGDVLRKFTLDKQIA